MKLYPALLLAFGLSCANPVLAQTDAPIRIHAGSIQVNQKTGKVIYRGKVRLRQGNMTIMANKVTSRISHGKVQHIIATGSPVLVQQTADAEFQATSIQSQRLEYTVAERSLVMSGHVQVQQGSDILQSDRIKYLVTNRTLSATAKPHQRIHASFIPRRNTESTQPSGQSAP